MQHKYTASELCDLFAGTSKYVMRDQLFQSFSIDSRKVQLKDLFFCIRGETTDGHHYIEQAFANGASCVIADRSRVSTSLYTQKLNFIFVQDPTTENDVKYKKMKAFVEKHISKAKAKYYHKYFLEHQANSKKQWQMINTLLKRNKKG